MSRDGRSLFAIQHDLIHIQREVDNGIDVRFHHEIDLRPRGVGSIHFISM